jgi:adenylate kinase
LILELGSREMSVTVFVAGVHGAGKSTICRELARLLGALHATAGDLIRVNANATTEAAVGVKAVPNVDTNQQLLLRELAVYRGRNRGLLLLDGHFVLLKPDGAIGKIPVAVYEAIAPVAVLLVEADAVTVHSRLLERDKTAPPVATITELAMQERAHSERVCGELKIPLWAMPGDGATDQAAVDAAARIRAILGNQESAK